MKKSKTPLKDYLRLPFEIYFSGSLNYTSWELMTDQDKILKPSDIKGIQVDQGRAYGVTFYCASNTGAELYCCITGSHGNATPKWLEMVEENDLNINYGEQHGVEVKSKGINLQAEADEEFDSFDSTGNSLSTYCLEEETPDYIILDADGDRIKINDEGYLINQDGEVDESQCFVDSNSLGEDESIGCAESLTHKQLQDEWISDVWKKLFPNNAPVKISKYA